MTTMSTGFGYSDRPIAQQAVSNYAAEGCNWPARASTQDSAEPRLQHRDKAHVADRAEAIIRARAAGLR